MTARSLTLPRTIDGSDLARRLQPAEGWATLAAVAVLAMTFGWSLDDAGWIPLVQGSTGYLPWLALLSTSVGIVLAKAGLGRLRTDLAGAIIGGLFLPFVAGSVLLANRNPGLGIDEILDRYRAAAEVAVQVWLDLAVNGQQFTNEYGHYHMIFAGLVWAAGLLAANAVVGRHRPLDAVVVTGLLLLTNEGLTAHEQLPILVVFSLAAMTLLIRTHVLEEQLTWVRRRIGDPATVSGLYLRGGTMFIGVAVLGALLLTGTASSAPLQGIWSDFPQKVAEIGRILQRLAPEGGQSRGSGIIGFGPSTVMNGLWSPDENAIAFTAHLPANDQRGYKWRAGTYAVYTLHGWEWGTTHDIERAERVPLLTGTGDDPVTDIARSAVRILIEPQGYVDASVVSPQTISWVDRPSTVLGVGEQNRFTTVEIPGSGPYTIEALVQNLGDATGGLTENRLRAAGRNYPSDIIATYLGVPDGSIGPAAQAILDQVEASFGGKDKAETKPYDLARALEAYFRSSANFTYATDIRSEIQSQCGAGISTVECFARIRRGFCQYYASAMTMLLRQAGIPARVAYGFLPGARDANGTEVVSGSASHWWVEVYFPRNGWVEFDPTGGQGQVQVLESGAPVTPPPSGLFTSRPDDRETDAIPRRSGSTSGPGGVTRSTGSGPFILVGGILLVAILVVAYAARRRSPHKPMHPDQAWGGLGRLAGRFGFGPRPQQTVYEYAGALGDVVPAVRVELTTVARAKVEVAYGRRELGDDRLRVIGDAYRRLRLAVLRAGIGRRLPRPFRRKRR